GETCREVVRRLRLGAPCPQCGGAFRTPRRRAPRTTPRDAPVPRRRAPLVCDGCGHRPSTLRSGTPLEGRTVPDAALFLAVFLVANEPTLATTERLALAAGCSRSAAARALEVVRSALCSCVDAPLGGDTWIELQALPALTNERRWFVRG